MICRMSSGLSKFGSENFELKASMQNLKKIKFIHQVLSKMKKMCGTQWILDTKLKVCKKISTLDVS
jgi:isopentenyl diphosphate isomerase/L-lactate dehydrogenase-like FMN-dependent dehydrogenase